MATGFVQIRDFFLGGEGWEVVTASPRPPSWWGWGPLRCPSPKPHPASALRATLPLCPPTLKSWLRHWYETFFDILERLSVDPECFGRTDGRTDRQTDRMTFSNSAL